MIEVPKLERFTIEQGFHQPASQIRAIEPRAPPGDGSHPTRRTRSNRRGISGNPRHCEEVIEKQPEEATPSHHYHSNSPATPK